MDTRKKIGAGYANGVAFLAYFDLLSVALLRRLRQIGEPVIAVVLDHPHALLPPRTRAELAASLSCVAAVVPCSGDPSDVLKRLQPAKIVHWETEDAERTSNLIDHVRKLYLTE